MVARVSLYDMHQDRDEPMRSFALGSWVKQTYATIQLNVQTARKMSAVQTTLYVTALQEPQW